MGDIKEIEKSLKRFAEERDWDKYLNPKDVLVAMMSEVGELAECYRWLSTEEIQKINGDPQKRNKIEDEIADIMMFLITIAYKSNIDIEEAIRNKMEKNAMKYPIEKIKGKHTNPIEGIKN